MTQPILSIYSPIFNHGEIIERNLDEMARQIREINAIDKIEIVLSNNCSTDFSEEKIKEFIVKNPDLIIVYSSNKTNIGGIKNIMDFGKKSSGKYVIMIGDDCFASGGLRNILEMLERDKDADFYLIKNNAYTDFKYLNNAATEDIIRDIEKIGFIGNFVLKKDYFCNNFKNYEASLTNFYPHMIMILEKISSAKKVIDTRFVAINIGESWDFRKQTKKVFKLLIDQYDGACLVKEFLEEKYYKLYVKQLNKWLYNNLKYIRWYKNRLDLLVYILKNLPIKNPKIIFGLFIYSLPAPLFYMVRFISIGGKYCKQCIEEMVENRKIWSNKKSRKIQDSVSDEYVGYRHC